MLEYLLPLAQSLLEQHPLPMALLSVIGGLRLIMKPLFSLLQAITQATPSPRDNEMLAKVMDSKIYKGLAFVLDWFGSVKLPK